MSIPDELVTHFASNDGVVFVGAGLSIGAGLAGWDQLIHRLVEELPCYPSGTSYEDIAQYYVNEHGRRRLVERLRRELDTYGLRPTSVHEAVVQLPASCMITTNYDDLLEQTLRSAGRRFDLVVNTADAGFWDSTRLQLVKMHGDLDRPDSIVITAEDYESYFETHPAIKRLVEASLQTKTVLFLGYSATDSNLRRLLTLVRLESGTLARHAYSVFLNPNRLEAKDMERRGLRVIALTVHESDSDHETDRRARRNRALAEWLIKLGDRVESERLRMPRKRSRRPSTLPSMPYKFLDFFSSADAAIFHGRETDTERLISLVEAYPLCVLYGESGTGKTSLIHAALTPRFEDSGYQVAYARPLGDPLDSTESAIAARLTIDASTLPSGPRLRAMVERGLPAGGRLFVVLDQFEEFFIRQGPQARSLFAKELVELLQCADREVRCLISLRSEYLDRLDELVPSIGRDLLRYRMRLYRLGPSGATVAIAEPAAAFGINLEPSLLERLLLDLDQGGIAPAQLQMVCYILWRDWQERGSPTPGLTLSRYCELGETSAILADYLDNVLEELKQPGVQAEYGLELDTDVTVEAARSVLKSMISAERTKIAVSGCEITRGELMARVGVPPSYVEPLLRYLSNRRVIRRLPESECYELAHEVLIDKIWGWVTDEERYILDLQDMLARSTTDYQRFNSLLPPDRLSLLTENIELLSVGPEAAELLLASAVEHNLQPELWVRKMERDEAVEVLARLLQGQRSTRYAQIAKALGATGSTSAVRYLEKLLGDKSNEVQRSAARGLSSLSLPIAARPLFHAAQRENKLVRVAPLLDGLEAIGTDEALGMLMILASEHPSTHVRTLAAKAGLRQLQITHDVRIIVRLVTEGEADIREGALRVFSGSLDERQDDYVAMLDDQDITLRLDLVGALGMSGGQCTTMMLTLALYNGESVVREAAAKALGTSDDPRIVDILSAVVLADVSAGVRKWAADSLGHSRYRQAVGPLIAALQDPDHEVRQCAASSLGLVGDEQAVEPLIAALQDTNGVVQEAAGSALKRIRQSPVLNDSGSEIQLSAMPFVMAARQIDSEEDIVTLIVALHDKEVIARRRAAEVLGRMGDVHAVGLLVSALQDVDTGVRMHAVTSLGQLGDRCAVEPLIAALRDPSNEVRQRAVDALGRLGDERAVEPLTAALQDSSAQVRWHAINTLGRMVRGSAVELLVSALKDASASVRWRAAGSLGWRDDERAVQPLIGALQDADVNVRKHAADSLGYTGDSRAIAPLIVALQDPSPEVRQRAAESLGRLGDERAVEPLTAALQDADINVRKHAADSLGYMCDSRVIAPLIAALQDPRPEVRQRAAESLGRRGDERAVEPLTAALQDADINVRKHAANSLRRLDAEREIRL